MKGRHGEKIHRGETEFTEGRESSQRGDIIHKRGYRFHRWETEFIDGRQFTKGRLSSQRGDMFDSSRSSTKSRWMWVLQVAMKTDDPGERAHLVRNAGSNQIKNTGQACGLWRQTGD